MIRILFQGDSITDGNRLKPLESRWDLNHQIGHSYAYPIVGKLTSMFPGKYACINRGISGNTVNDLKTRWEADTLAENPDILSILIGVNGNGNFDGNYPEGVEEHLRSFDETYRFLLTSAREKNPDLKIVLIEPFILPVAQVKPHYDVFYPIFCRKQEIVAKIAEDFNAVFVPVQKKLEEAVEKSAPLLTENGCTTDPCAYWMWDGIHPTEALHWMISELWLEAARDIL